MKEEDTKKRTENYISNIIGSLFVGKLREKRKMKFPHSTDDGLNSIIEGRTPKLRYLRKYTAACWFFFSLSIEIKNSKNEYFFFSPTTSWSFFCVYILLMSPKIYSRKKSIFCSKKKIKNIELSWKNFECEWFHCSYVCHRMDSKNNLSFFHSFLHFIFLCHFLPPLYGLLKMMKRKWKKKWNVFFVVCYLSLFIHF